MLEDLLSPCKQRLKSPQLALEQSKGANFRQHFRKREGGTAPVSLKGESQHCCLVVKPIKMSQREQISGGPFRLSGITGYREEHLGIVQSSLWVVQGEEPRVKKERDKGVQRCCTINLPQRMKKVQFSVQLGAQTDELRQSKPLKGATRDSCSLRDGRPGAELNAQACRAVPLQPVSVPHYRSEVSRAGLEMVPSIRHSLVVAGQSMWYNFIWSGGWHRTLQFERQAVPPPPAPPWIAVREKGAGHPCPRKGLDVYVQKWQLDGKPSLGWRLNHFPGQPVPMLENPFSEEKFPNIQSKPPLVQLEAISSCPITCYLGEETDPHLSTTSFQVVVESDEVSPQPPFLQAKQPQLPQPLLIRLLLQTLHQLRCPSLDSLQPLNVPLVVGGPKLNTVVEVRPHQCRVQGHDHFPSPAGHAIFDTSQDAIGFLGHLGTLLAHIQAAVNQHSQVLLCWAAFQPLFPKPVALHGVAVAHVQDLALGLVKPHTIDLSPSIQPVQVPLQSLPTLQQINTPTQLGVICKLTESALDPFVQIIDKDVKQNWPQHRALGNTTCDRPPTGVNSIHHHSLGPAVQPVLYPVKSTPVQAMNRHFLQENAVGNHVKGFTEV
ncbi:hypothetical protein QYF61_018675 [Mycteria americana]|uniref:Uncharacterized protein n=1 Tax=Mycteria americana TaxID=33587 RepID=A0AAN7SL43_MYCAM|nr:hypothetical protein QYF61_018675 [Mycteria americana]